VKSSFLVFFDAEDLPRNTIMVSCLVDLDIPLSQTRRPQSLNTLRCENQKFYVEVTDVHGEPVVAR
jgi:hypothetical protein